MYETVVTIVGNVVDTPRLRRTGSGVDVANFRIASTSRRFDRTRECWVDNGTVYLGVACWRQLGANVAYSLQRGDPVMVTGRLVTRSYEVNGQPRSTCEVEATAVGHDLTRGTATFERTARRGPEGGQDTARRERWGGGALAPSAGTVPAGADAPPVGGGAVEVSASDHVATGEEAMDDAA